MTEHIIYTFPSPATGYENAEPLTEDVSEDGKSLKNPQTGVLSPAYQQFIDPLDSGRRGGFDIHIYYKKSEQEYARQLYDRIRREFPELRIYRFWDKPVGPHPYPMFEVNLFTPAQFGAFVSWLVIWRGPLSVLVHPNTIEQDGVLLSESELRNHTQRATWMGDKVPLDLTMFYQWRAKEAAERAAKGN